MPRRCPLKYSHLSSLPTSSFGLSFPSLSADLSTLPEIPPSARECMADYLSLPDVEDPPATVRKSSRIASIDVFRGLCVFLMMVVDYVGQVFTGIAHSPWNGLRLADFVMPFFLFIAGVSLALVYKKVTNRVEATHKSALRAVKLFFLGVLLQGGYFHGINSLTYGVDIERIRWFGILQRISIGYLIAALCEIWLTRRTHSEVAVLKSYHWHWFLATFLSVVYLCLLYGLYVPDWQFEALSSAEATSSTLYTVECSSRGDLGPACNSAVMIDRHIVGIGHLYMKPVYRNLKVCNMSTSGLFDQNSPSWCHAPFDPEGILSSLTAAVTCVIGLQYGHILTNVEDPWGRLHGWLLLSVLQLILGVFLAIAGIPVNKSLYSVSYMLITTSSAGFLLCALYLLVDIQGFKRSTAVLGWMGKHSLCIFVFVSSNLAITVIQGFYWRSPSDNLIHWFVALFVKT